MAVPVWAEGCPRAVGGTSRTASARVVSAMTARSTQSRTSFSASLGTMKDARKIGKNLFPVHRKATISPSAASKVSVCCSTFAHCRPAAYDVQARLVSRSCGSFRQNRPADCRPRHRTSHDVPPLRLPYVSTSALPTSVDLLLFPNGPAVVWVLGGIRSGSTESRFAPL